MSRYIDADKIEYYRDCDGCHGYELGHCNDCTEPLVKTFKEDIDNIPTEDVVSRSVFEQIKWERDIAIQQLNELGYALGEKPKTKSMQVELEGDGYSDGELVYDYGKCPKCGWEFEDGDKDWEEPYCCHCGQKLHWFESENIMK